MNTKKICNPPTTFPQGGYLYLTTWGGHDFFHENLKKSHDPPIGSGKKSRPPLLDQEKSRDIPPFATKF